MKPKFLLPIFILVLGFYSCKTDDDANDVICTLEYVYGLNVTLIDASNSNKIIDDVTVVSKDGSYEETLTAGIDSFYGSGERAGTYTITITSDNYETYTSAPITVTADICHVIPQTFELTLQPK